MASGFYSERSISRGFHWVGFHIALSCLAMAVQIRGNSKHAGISCRLASVVAPECHLAGTPRIGFVLTSATVRPPAVVLDRSVARPTTQLGHKSKCLEEPMDLTSDFHRCLCSGVIALDTGGRLYELPSPGNIDLDCCRRGDEIIYGLPKIQIEARLAHETKHLNDWRS